MRTKILPALTIIILLAAVVTGGCQPRQGNGQELEALQQENEQLQAQVSALEEERDSLQQQLQEADEVNMQPNPGWEQFFSEGEESPLEGESVEEVRELLGRPPFLIRSTAAEDEFNREIWIFMPLEEDPTGLYLWFKGDELWDWSLDEFNGLYSSGLLQDEGFWLD